MNAAQPIMRNVAMPSRKSAFPVFLDYGDKRTWSPLVEEVALPEMKKKAKKENEALRRICNMSAPDVKASASEIRDVKMTAHEAIKAQPGITAKHLGAQMDVSDTRINQIVASLARSGHITRERDNVWSSYSLRITGLPLEVEGHKTRADVKAHAEKARRALIFIADNPGCRPPHVAKAIDATEGRAQKVLLELYRGGYVTRERSKEVTQSFAYTINEVAS